MRSLGRETKTVEDNGRQLEYWDYGTILRKLGHTKKKVTLLKIDVEGYEFDLLSGKPPPPLL